MPSVRRLSLTRWRRPHADGWIDEAAVGEQAGGEGGVDVVLDARHVVVGRVTTRRARRRSGHRRRTGSAGLRLRSVFVRGRPATPARRRSALRDDGVRAWRAARSRDSVSSTASHQVCVDRGSGDEVDDRARDHAERAAGADRELRRVEAPAVLAQRCRASRTRTPRRRRRPPRRRARSGASGRSGAPGCRRCWWRSSRRSPDRRRGRSAAGGRARRRPR